MDVKQWWVVSQNRIVSRPLFIYFVLVAVMIPFATAQAQSAQEYVNSGDWEEAHEEALLRDDAASMRIRARFALWAGDDEDALRFAQAAVRVSTSDEQRRRSEAEVARLEWFFGDRDQALERLRQQLRGASNDLELRYELGWRLIDDGDVEEGRAILEAMARRYNDGMITEVDELVWLGRAMHAAERPRDANRALSRAVGEDGDHLEANLRLGQLMWSRHNTAEAEAAFKKVLEHHKDHPEALVGMARIEFYRSGQFDKAAELVDRARDNYPGHPDVILGRAEMLLARGAWGQADVQAQRLLDRSPQHGEALALVASAAFLRAKQSRFQEVSAIFDERRSSRPDLLTTVGEFAAMNNRHRASVEHFEGALERDDEYGPALAGLGIALTRIGEEVRGIETLERAFDVDRYRVPVFNTLELYDRGLRDYVTDDLEGLRLRAHKSQYELVRERVVQLVEEAKVDLGERYGVELPSLTIEIFADSQAFSVRSVGLPHIDPHGICFGRVVLTRSPGDGNFNWPMVVWHELAHSYHLELSGESVPVWFTEGLAEYETRRRDGSWTRFHDLELARRLQHGQIWSITEMSEVFRTGRGIEVSHAYQISMLISIFLDETYGFDSIVEILERFADTPDTGEVFEATLQMPVAAVDEAFEEWLRDRYSRLLAQELIDWSRLQAMRSDEEVEHESAAIGSAYRALVAAAMGDGDQARLNLRNALRSGEDDPMVAVIAVLAYDRLDAIDEGLELGRKTLDAGVESFDLRYSMSKMAGRADRNMEAYVHAVAAVGLVPEEAEAWRLLVGRARAVDQEALAERASRELFERDPHSAELARRQLGFFEDRGDYDGAYRAALRWTEIAALDASAHLAVARTSARRGKLDEAQAAWERAAVASPARRNHIWQIASEELRQVGADEQAQEFEGRIEDE